jgi:hypothetical protein
MRIVSRGMAITIAALSFAGSASAAPVETVLYTFAGASDGHVPFAGLIANEQGTRAASSARMTLVMNCPPVSRRRVSPC